MNEIRLFDLPHEDARALLATGVPVYLCVNPVEYHGPHLSLHNDRLISEGLARALHARTHQTNGVPFVLADDLEVGVEPCRGLGTRVVPFDTARTLIREACRALAELGARKVVIMTFHGAPLHGLAIEAGVDELRARGVKVLAPFNAILREWLEETSGDGAAYAAAFAHIEDPEERAEMMRGLHLDFHAGFFETSMTLWCAPHSVSPRHRELPPCPPITPNVLASNAAKLARMASGVLLREGRGEILAKELGLVASGLGWQALEPFPGYTGRPHHATAAAGAVFAGHILDRYEQLVASVLRGDARSPTPILAWTAALSANGRILPKSPVPATERLTT